MPKIISRMFSSFALAVMLGGTVIAAPRIQVDLHIIGFSVDQSTERQLRDMATAGQGRYYQSTSGAELLSALGEAVGVTPPPTGTPFEKVESEPNNSFGTADRIASAGEIEGTIDTVRDSDWYRFEVNHQGALEIRTTAVPADLDVVFRVWNREKSAITGWMAPLRVGGETKAVIDLPAKGLYILEVRDGRDDAASGEPYRLSFTFTPTVDTAEPNNRFGAAAPLKLGDEIRANILPIRDADWYRIEVDHQGALTVKLSESSPELDLVFRVWNQEKSAITGWYAPLAKGGDTEGVVDLPAKGIYYIEVRDGRDDARSAKPYKLAAAFAPTADTTEPNNSFGTAASIPIGQDIQANILPLRDSDWYEISVAGHGELKVTLSDVPPELDVVLRAWNLEKSAITGWYSPSAKGGDTVATIDLPDAGPYFLEVRDGRDDARSSSPYSMRTEFTVSVDANEPNNDIGSAKPAIFDQTVQATIFPKRDHDFYRLEVGAAGSLDISISKVPDNLDIVFRVWNEKKSAITGWTSPLRPGGDTVGKATLPAAGTYFIELADGRDDARAIEPYTLQLAFSGPVTVKAKPPARLGTPAQQTVVIGSQAPVPQPSSSDSTTKAPVPHSATSPALPAPDTGPLTDTGEIIRAPWVPTAGTPEAPSPMVEEMRVLLGQAARIGATSPPQPTPADSEIFSELSLLKPPEKETKGDWAGFAALPTDLVTEIKKMQVQPQPIEPGSRFRVMLDFLVWDPETVEDDLVVRVTYEIIRGGKVLARLTRTELQVKNGETARQILPFRASTRSGDYSLRAALEYKSKAVEKIVDIHIK